MQKEVQALKIIQFKSITALQTGLIKAEVKVTMVKNMTYTAMASLKLK